MFKNPLKDGCPASIWFLFWFRLGCFIACKDDLSNELSFRSLKLDKTFVRTKCIFVLLEEANQPLTRFGRNWKDIVGSHISLFFSSSSTSLMMRTEQFQAHQLL